MEDYIVSDFKTNDVRMSKFTGSLLKAAFDPVLGNSSRQTVELLKEKNSS